MVEASPRSAYGAGLEYQLGRKSLASSNLAASADREFSLAASDGAVESALPLTVLWSR